MNDAQKPCVFFNSLHGYSLARAFFSANQGINAQGIRAGFSLRCANALKRSSARGHEVFAAAVRASDKVSRRCSTSRTFIPRTCSLIIEAEAVHIVQPCT